MKITPLSAHIGAEISEVDLAALDDALFAEIRAALLQYEVIFFRGQDIAPAVQYDLARRFGPLQSHPAYATVEGFPEITILESTPDKPTLIEKWHSDMTFRLHPPVATVLRSRIIPEKGGDTLWASMTAAYDALSAPMKQFLQGLRAEHDFAHGFKESLAQPGGRERLKQALLDNPPVDHPVIHTHPETGKKVIFVNSLFTTRILELSLTESDAVLQFLYQHVTQPEFAVRFRWQPDCLAIWDNRSTQHKPVNDYFPAHRRLERVVIDGDRPY